MDGARMTDDEAFEALLEFVRDKRGFDFTGYKRSSLQRRVAKRMSEVEIEGFADYLDYLQVNPEEFAYLFNTVLINVTRFFRDDEPWDYIRRAALPRIAKGKGPEDPIRVWVAGCSSGEEAYTVAMLLAEVLGDRTLRERTKIYATDVDDEALETARHASYDERSMENVPLDLRERYFERSERHWTFRADLRRSIIFGRNDLGRDAPISRVDLLTCRNTLMYFNADTQARIIEQLHFALNPHGYLMLGRSEMLIARREAFTTVDLKRRVFTKVAKPTLRERLLFLGQGGNHAPTPNAEAHVTARDSALESSPVGQLLIDRDGLVVTINRAARELFGLGPGDAGRPLQDLEVSYRPIELRSGIERAQALGQMVSLGRVEWNPRGGEPRTLSVEVMPLVGPQGESFGTSISFHDVTAHRRLQVDHERSVHELEHAQEELQSTVEELETTNEELQSTNEELETTNEELQSTNEELETMNEELHSTNEELETMNDELTLRGGELDRVNGFLEGILTSLKVGVAVLDGDLRVQVWNASSEDLWGLRPDEVVGDFFLGLDIGLPVDGLVEPIERCRSGRSERESVVLEARNRRGHDTRCQVTCLPMRAERPEVTGVLILMEADGTATTAAPESEEATRG
jgi:two-component system, chemotaxis family, CheB/CheR fusion protein